MRVFVIVALFALIAAAASQEDKDYTPFFKDETKVKAAVDCLLDKGPCGEVQGLRDRFPTLVKDSCGSCTPNDKARYDEVNKILQENHPEYLKALIEKYGPAQ